MSSFRKRTGKQEVVGMQTAASNQRKEGSPWKKYGKSPVGEERASIGSDTDPGEMETEVIRKKVILKNHPKY